MIVFEDLEESNYAGIADEILRKFPGEYIYTLIGDLGAGKTSFAKYFCNALGVSKEDVNSPTFPIINTYFSQSLNQELYHMDFYRIEDELEAEEIDIYDYFENANYCLIEWPSNIKNLLPKKHVEIEIVVQKDQKRCFRIRQHDGKT